MATLGTTSTRGRKIVEKRDDDTALAVTGRGRADRSSPTGHGQRTYTHTKHAPLKIKTGHGRRERPNSVTVVHKADEVSKVGTKRQERNAAIAYGVGGSALAARSGKHALTNPRRSGVLLGLSGAAELGAVGHLNHMRSKYQTPVGKALIPSSIITGSQAQPAKKAAVAAGGNPKQRAKVDGVATVNKAFGYVKTPAFTRTTLAEAQHLTTRTPPAPKVAQSVETKVKRSLHEPHGTSYKGYRNTPQLPKTAGENNYFAKGAISRLIRRPKIKPLPGVHDSRTAFAEGERRAYGAQHVVPGQKVSYGHRIADGTRQGRKTAPYTGKTGFGKAYDPEGKRQRRSGLVGGAALAGAGVTGNMARKDIKAGTRDSRAGRYIGVDGKRVAYNGHGKLPDGVKLAERYRGIHIRPRAGRLALASAGLGALGVTSAAYGGTHRGRSYA